MSAGDENYTLQLAEKLQQLCIEDEQGTEENFAETVTTLHNFGLHYRKQSPDKISLMRSAAFFNSALSLQPGNQQIIADLNELCTHVLQLAKAKKTDADLTEISATVKLMMEELRTSINEEMKSVKLTKLNSDQLEKPPASEKLPVEIFEKYSEILTFISDQCKEILGKNPCDFSISEMESLDPNKVSLNDFKLEILLENGIQNTENFPEILEYFQWFSVIFEIIRINLQETEMEILILSLN